MSDKQARELRRRRRRYAWEARCNRYANLSEKFLHGVFFRLSPRLRTRVRPSVVVVAASILVGVMAGTIYWALNELGLTPFVLSFAVTLTLWLLAAVGALLRRFVRAESGHVPPPPSSGGGFSGVREPRRPPPNPKAMPVEMPEPIGKEE